MLQSVSQCAGVARLLWHGSMLGDKHALVITPYGAPILSIDNRDVLFEHAKRLWYSLQQVHAHGIVHGDVKPGNIILYAGSPVLIDFEHAFFEYEHWQGRGHGTPQFSPPLHDLIDKGPEWIDIVGLCYSVYSWEHGGTNWDIAPSVYELATKSEVVQFVLDLAGNNHTNVR